MPEFLLKFNYFLLGGTVSTKGHHTTVWKFDGKLEEGTRLRRPNVRPGLTHWSRSYVINKLIFHVSVNGADRYYKFHILIERFLNMYMI